MTHQPDSNEATDSIAQDAAFRLGDWRVEPEAGTLVSDMRQVALEPKVAALLLYLSRRPGRVVSRAELEEAVWEGRVIGEDVLSRTLSKLRKALGDDASAPRYIETLSKRGYRLIAEVVPDGRRVAETFNYDAMPLREKMKLKAVLYLIGIGLLTVMMLVIIILLSSQDRAPVTEAVPEAVAAPGTEAQRLSERADDLYMNFTRADNEAAIALYRRAITTDPDHAPAQSGLANALVQRVVRWSSQPGLPRSAESLTQAIKTGLTSAPEARATLERAVLLGERAVRAAPSDATAHKALGFAYAANGRTDEAISAYETAIELDPDAWDAWINLWEMQEMREPGNGLASLLSAYESMERRYETSPHTVGPWLAPAGILIADRLLAEGQRIEAERWYRRVLETTPFEPEATARLARLQYQSGNRAEAQALCTELAARVGPTPGCGDVLDAP